MSATAELNQGVHNRENTLTSFNVLLDCIFNHAFVGLLSGLRLHTGACISSASLVKRVLQSITLPSEQVVAVPGVASPVITVSKPSSCKTLTAGSRRYSLISHAVDERLGPICGPVGLVVELSRVPHHLVHHLRKLDGVAGWAWARRLEGPAAGVCHVGLVVRAVDIHSIPTPSER